MPAIPPPSFSAWPPTPQRLVDAPEAYILKADPWADHLPVASAEMEAAAANVAANADLAEGAADTAEGHASTAAAAAATALGATTLAATSDSPMSLAAGTYAVHLNETGRDYADGRVLVATRRGDPNARLTGEVDNWDGLDFDFIVGVNGVSGSGGPYTDWDFLPATYYDIGATAAQMLAEDRDDVAATPAAYKAARSFAALTDAGTVTPNGLNGRNFTWTIGGDRTLGAITNCAVNQVYTIEITQNGTGGWDLAWGTGLYEREGGLPTLAQAAGAVSILQIRIRAVDGSGTMTKGFVSFATNLED